MFKQTFRTIGHLARGNSGVLDNYIKKVERSCLEIVESIRSFEALALTDYKKLNNDYTREIVGTLENISMQSLNMVENLKNLESAEQSLSREDSSAILSAVKRNKPSINLKEFEKDTKLFVNDVNIMSRGHQDLEVKKLLNTIHDLKNIMDEYENVEVSNFYETFRAQNTKASSFENVDSLIVKFCFMGPFSKRLSGGIIKVAGSESSKGSPSVAIQEESYGAESKIEKSISSKAKKRMSFAKTTEKKDDSDDDFTPGSTEHKAQRWEEYQDRGGSWNKDRWSKQYEINMKNNKVGLQREADYREVMGASTKTIKTPYTRRQIDMYNDDEMYLGQLKTGKVYHTEQAKIDIEKDGWLVKEGYEVEYILEDGASGPFIEALEKNGIKYKIGPQIPK